MPKKTVIVVAADPATSEKTVTTGTSDERPSTSGESLQVELKSPQAKAKKPMISTTTPQKGSIKLAVPKMSPHTSAEKSSSKKSPGAVPPSKIKIKPETSLAYKFVRKSSGALGGNGYDGAIYGELTMHSMQKVIDFLVAECELDASSRFIDIGSGLGKPNFHAAQDPQVRISIGVELEDIRWQLAMYNLQQALLHASDDCVPGSHSKANIYACTQFIVGDIDRAASTDPFTHIYQFDLGFPPPLQQSIAAKFNSSCHAKYLVSYRPPHRVIEEYGYLVEFKEQISTSMHGSGEGHTAYIYKRLNTPAPVLASHTKVRLPGRARLNEADVEVVCDPLFEEAVHLAAGPLVVLKAHVGEVVRSKFLEVARPKRERKPTQKA